ncbi:MAG TPA: hydantoinase/oxoprolinase family protein [Calditerricola sp.]
MSIRVATDIGGTFTDLVYLDEASGRVGVAKAPTTPRNFAHGVLNAIEKAGFDPRTVTAFVHGTTVVINALTERKGVKTGLITTRGFRDVLEIGRANRPDIYNLRYRKPEPFVPRHLRLEVTERVGPHGEVITPLAEDEIVAAVEQLRAEGVEAIAICFLHSYANPDHERLAAAIVRDLWPEVAVSASHEITREFREYERTSTVVLNAYVKPIAERYLQTLETNLRAMGIGCELHVMKSNGGTSTFAMGQQTPIQLVESGPVGGVIGASVIGELIGIPNIITLDIGGTTAKTSLIENGRVKVTTEYRIEWTPTNPGYPIKTPVVDIIEIGAGGGSIVHLDATGAVRVGPQSAGADPGPACYGKGGTDPTVTDANLIAGRLNPDYFLGGEMKLDVDRAVRAFEPIARRLGLSVRESALGAIRLANNNMITALKLISVRRGYDPRDFALLACGGGGSLHAAILAEELNIGKVIVPNYPAHFSAWGMLGCDLRHDLVRTLIRRLDQVAPGDLQATYEAMEAEALDLFRGEGVEPERVFFVRRADMRYLGQEHTVQVEVPGGPFGPETLGTIAERFHAAHEQAYTYRLPDVPVEIVNLTLTAYGRVTKPRLPRLPEVANPSAEDALKGYREVDFDARGVLRTAIYERDRLPTGARVEGPAIVEEPAASTVVYPGQLLEVDAYGNLIITTEVGRRGR